MLDTCCYIQLVAYSAPAHGVQQCSLFNSESLIKELAYGSLFIEGEMLGMTVKSAVKFLIWGNMQRLSLHP